MEGCTWGAVAGWVREGYTGWVLPSGATWYCQGPTDAQNSCIARSRTPHLTPAFPDSLLEPGRAVGLDRARVGAPETNMGEIQLIIY